MRGLPFAEIYEVGGSIRDELLGRARKDADFLVRGVPLDELRRELGRHGRADDLVVAGRLVGRALLAALRPEAGRRGRAAAARGADPARRRGATPATRTATSASRPIPTCRSRPTSSAATSPSTRSPATSARAAVDPFGGRADLAAGSCGSSTQTAFRDDPLRILRGLVRQSKDGLVPDDETRRLMREWAPRIAELSAERVRESLDQILLGTQRGDALRLARDVGALRRGGARAGPRPASTRARAARARSTST